MILATLLGSALGIISGIIPGLHSNTFASLLVSFSALLALYFSPPEICALIITSAIAYTIANIIPAIFLGIPSEDTAIGILPSHRMVLEGRGFEALTISCFASLLAIFLSLPLFLTTIFVAKNYTLLRELTPFVLISIAVLLVMSEKRGEFEGELSAWRKRLYAALVFLLSGFLGLVALSNSQLAEITPAGTVLFPMLTGLFGAPVLLLSAFGRNANMPKQIRSICYPNFLATIRGSIAGFFVSIFPGISSGVATVLASLGERRNENYIAAMSSANTANAILCFFMFLTTERVRSGAVSALKSLNLSPSFSEIAALSVIAGILSFAATISIGFLLAIKLSSIDVKKMSIATFVFLFSLVFAFTGFFGLAVFLSSIPIGLSTAFLGVKRVNCMGCLILPLIIWYI
ncbi:MAG: tripartite tricarboxylate transporter permease [Archaeoglobaceae archaeon]